MAQLVVSAAGAAIGFVASGGNPLGAQLGWAAGSVLGSFLGPKQRNEGPRLQDLKVTGSSYGQPIPYIEGHPRVAGQIIWASAKREVSNTSGGKGGPSTSNTTFTYEVDLLLLVSINEIVGVRRIWSNGELVFTAADDASVSSIAASKVAPSWTEITVYTGSSSQLPDATYEAAVGSGNAPAYRGRGTILIRGLNLGTSGQLPNLTFEVLTESVNGSNASIISNELYGNSRYFGVTTTYDPNGFTVMSIAWAATPTIVDVYQIDSAGHHTSAGSFAHGISSFGVANKGTADIECIYLFNNLNGWLFSSAGVLLMSLTNAPYQGAIVAKRGDRFAVTNNTLVTLHSYPSGTLLASNGTLTGSPDYLAIASDFIYAMTAGKDKIYKLDPTTLALVSTIDTSAIFGVNAFILTDDAGTLYFVTTFTTSVSKVYKWNGTSFDFLFTAATVGGVSNHPSGWISTTHQLRTGDWEPNGGGRFVIAGNENVLGLVNPTLDSVVSRLCARASLTAGQLDVTALSGKTVRSMAVGQVASTRSVLEMLAAAYLFNAVESDKIKFVLRGGASAATIPYASMGASAGQPAEPLPLSLANDIEAPVQVTVRYVNVSNDYQDGSESSDRLLGPSGAVQVSEVPLGLTPQEAKTLADITVMDVAASLRSFGPVALSLDYAHLEPTDVVTLTDSDGTTYRGRILKDRTGGGIKTVDGVIEDASILTSTVATTTTGYTDSTVVAGLTDTTMQLLDIPLLRDADDSAGFYVAFKGTSPWPGATLFDSGDNVTYTEDQTVSESTQIGTCTTTLGNWAGGTVFDETNSVTVNVGAQTLTSYSRDEILNGTAPGYVVGSELLYARTATLVTAGVYTLSGLLRGRRGTEWAMTGHAASERFAALPLSGSGLRRVGLSTTDIGVLRYYKGVTAGRALSTATAQTLACQGIGQKPFAPVDLRATTDPGRDITLTWKRRTRYASRLTGAGGISVPLGEDAETYEVDILLTAGGSVRRILSVTTQQCVYTAALQYTDFGALQSTVHAVIYQTSAAFGRGYPLTASVSVPATNVSSVPPGTRPVMEMGGVLYAASQTRALTSSDNGQSYTVARDDGTPAVYSAGLAYFDALLGTQRISVGWNLYANFAGMIVGTDSPAGAATEYKNDSYTQPWYTHGYPRAGSAPLAVGALYGDGTYYYIVGRLADASQAAGTMYLYRADAGLSFALQGQLAQDVADPNALADGTLGDFSSYWFTPNFTTDSYAARSKLMQFGGRWFLWSPLALYYTDDTPGITGWLRCPTGLGEGATNPPVALMPPIKIGTRMLVARSSDGAYCVSVSADNGATWTASLPIPAYGMVENLVAFGSTALLYYRFNGLFYVASSTSPFTSWTLALVEGIAPGAGLSEVVVSGSFIAALTSIPAGFGYSQLALVYSSDSITFAVASVTP